MRSRSPSVRPAGAPTCSLRRAPRGPLRNVIKVNRPRAEALLRGWRWGGWRGGAALLIYLALGAILAPSPHDRGLFNHSFWTVVVSLAIGAAVAACVLVLVGLLLFGIHRAGSESVVVPFGSLAPLTLGCSLALLLAAAAVRAIEDGGGVNARGGGVKHAAGQRVRTEEARAWSASLTPIVITLRQPYLADPPFRRRVLNSADTEPLRAQAAHQRAKFSRALVRVRNLSVPAIPAIRLATDELERGLALLSSGYREIQLGLAASRFRRAMPAGARNRRLLRIGVSEASRGRRLMQRFSAHLVAVGPLLYGR
jgi:hypothetical protein